MFPSSRQIVLVWDRTVSSVQQIQTSAVLEHLLAPLFLTDNAEFANAVAQAARGVPSGVHQTAKCTAPIVKSNNAISWYSPSDKLRVVLHAAIVDTSKLDDVPLPVQRLLVSAGASCILRLCPLWARAWSVKYDDLHTHMTCSLDLIALVALENESRRSSLGGWAELAGVPDPGKVITADYPWMMWRELLVTYVACCSAMPMLMQPRAVDNVLFPAVVGMIFNNDVQKESSSNNNNSDERTEVGEITKGAIRAALALRKFFAACREANRFVAPTSENAGAYAGIIAGCEPYLAKMRNDPFIVCHGVFDENKAENAGRSVTIVQFVDAEPVSASAAAQALLKERVITKRTAGILSLAHMCALRVPCCTSDDADRALAAADLSCRNFTLLDQSVPEFVTFMFMPKTLLRFACAALHIVMPLSLLDDPVALMNVGASFTKRAFSLLLERAAPSESATRESKQSRSDTLFEFVRRHGVSLETINVIAALVYTPAHEDIYVEQNIGLAFLFRAQTSISQHQQQITIGTKPLFTGLCRMITKASTGRLSVTEFNDNEARPQTMHARAVTDTKFVAFSHDCFSGALQLCSNQQNEREPFWAAVRAPLATSLNTMFQQEYPVVQADRAVAITVRMMGKVSALPLRNKPSYVPDTIPSSNVLKWSVKLPINRDMAQGFGTMAEAAGAPMSVRLLTMFETLRRDHFSSDLPGASSIFEASLVQSDDDIAESPVYNPTSPVYSDMDETDDQVYPDTAVVSKNTAFGRERSEAEMSEFNAFLRETDIPN